MANKHTFTHKICRRLGVSVCGAVNCSLARRPNPPGQHGANRRQKVSPFGEQLLETQKLRYYYGVSAKQLRRFYTEAASSKKQTNIAMIEKLERRLDNIVYRLGFARTLRAARQMVVHRHFTVNGKSVNKPGYLLNPGDTIQLRPKSQEMAHYKEWWQNPHAHAQELKYIERDAGNFSGKLARIPEREEIPILVNDHLVVEFMAR